MPSAGNAAVSGVDPGFPERKESVVRSLNEFGDYVLEWLDVPGGIRHYSSKVYRTDGMEILFPGDTVRPFVIGDADHIIGGQIIQTFVQDIFSPSGDEIPEVSGVGWLLTQEEVDALPLNEAGLYDVDGDILWPATFYRPVGFTEYETTVSDVNDVGEFVVQYHFGGLYSSRFCSPIEDSQVKDIYGGVHPVPWTCEFSTYAGGKAFRGVNDIGDAVGSFTPGVYQYQSSYPTQPPGMA